MRRLLLSTAALAFGASVAQAADLITYAPPVVDNTAYAAETPSDFYFSAEALALWRSSTDTELWEDEGTLSLTSTRDIEGLGMGFGAKFTAGGPITDAFGWQVSGFWAGSFSSSGTSISPTEELNAIYTGNVTPGNHFFDNSQDAYALTFTESSSVGGLEASATYEMDGFRLLVGPRWIRYQSSLGTVVYDEEDDFLGADNGIDRVDITSTNNLIGVQAGIEGMYPLAGAISIGGRAAVGLYVNNATLERTFTADNGNTPFNTDTVSSTTSTSGFAQSVELSPKVVMAVTENLDISLGGTLLYLNGVDEPGTHLAGIGEDDGTGELAADTPSLTNGVHFAGLTLGVQGRF